MRVAATDEDSEMPFEFRQVLGYPVTDFGWPVVPEALREWLVMTRARFRAALPPLMITESGCSYNVEPDENGVVDDQARIDYLESHLNAVATAIRRGVDVRGYYAGRCSTTSSGPRATPSGSASSTSTSRPRSAPRRGPSTGTASSSPRRPRASTDLSGGSGLGLRSGHRVAGPSGRRRPPRRSDTHCPRSACTVGVGAGSSAAPRLPRPPAGGEVMRMEQPSAPSA